MIGVQEVRHRLLFEQLERWVERLSSKKPIEPEEVEELAVRLLAMASILLRQHVVGKRGRCRLCGWSILRWPFWYLRPRCTVFRSVDLAVGQSLDVVWWRLLGSVGREVRLVEVREWVAQRSK